MMKSIGKQLKDLLTSEQIGSIVKLSSGDGLNHNSLLAIIKTDDTKYKDKATPEFLAYAIENVLNEAEEA